MVEHQEHGENVVLSSEVIKQNIADKKDKYNKYLASLSWQNIRIRVIERDCNKCKMCGSKHNLRVHHLSYYEWETYGEDKGIDHLITLCRNCHSDVHVFPNVLREAASWASHKKRPVNFQISDTLPWPDKEGSEEYDELKNFFIVRSREINHALDKELEELIRNFEKKRKLNMMIAVTDAFIVSRCKELSASGDVEMFTGVSGALNDYIKGLFSYNPYYNVSKLWEQLGDGTAYYRNISRNKYNSWRLLVKKCIDERKRKKND